MLTTVRTRSSRRTRISAAAVAVFAATAVSCDSGSEGSTVSTSANEIAVTDVAITDALRSLADRRIYFGHQSVGNNVLAGLQSILAEAPGTGVQIVESRDPSTAAPGATIVHFAAGTNGDPASKNSDFIRALDARPAPDNGIALLKYCYIDVDENTDIDAVFRDYQAMVAQLHQSHPDLTIVHVTMPLTTDEVGAKATIKRIIGRVTGREINALRNRYNEKLRSTYANEPIFDLATIESTRPDGSRESASVGGREVFALVPEYSYDGGHLTPEAEKRVAEFFVRTLAGIPTAE